jgi:PleD family two-component response regulator
MPSYTSMTHQSDLALYASKAAGRNRVTCYDPSLEKLAAEAKH